MSALVGLLEHNDPWATSSGISMIPAPFTPVSTAEVTHRRSVATSPGAPSRR
jgi:hypothetical protein